MKLNYDCIRDLLLYLEENLTKVYTKTKSVLSSFKSVSIEIFTETASKVLTSLISKQFGLPD